jgi:hypothetical protein
MNGNCDLVDTWTLPLQMSHIHEARIGHHYFICFHALYLHAICCNWLTKTTTNCKRHYNPDVSLDGHNMAAMPVKGPKETHMKVFSHDETGVPLATVARWPITHCREMISCKLFGDYIFTMEPELSKGGLYATREVELRVYNYKLKDVLRAAVRLPSEFLILHIEPKRSGQFMLLLLVSYTIHSLFIDTNDRKGRSTALTKIVTPASIPWKGNFQSISSVMWYTCLRNKLIRQVIVDGTLRNQAIPADGPVRIIASLCFIQWNVAIMKNMSGKLHVYRVLPASNTPF